MVLPPSSTASAFHSPPSWSHHPHTFMCRFLLKDVLRRSREWPEWKPRRPREALHEVTRHPCYYLFVACCGGSWAKEAGSLPWKVSILVITKLQDLPHLTKPPHPEFH